MNLCQHFGACGGCTSQHLSYLLQLAEKQKTVELLFSLPVRPIVPCAHPWEYRNKMEFSFSQDKKGEKFLGLILKKSRGKVFHLHECLIAAPWFTEVVKRVRAWWEMLPLKAYNFRTGEGVLRNLTVREGKRTGGKMVILTLSSRPGSALTKKALEKFVEAIGDPAVSIFVRLQQCIKGKPTQFYELHLSGPTHITEELTVGGKKLVFNISPTSFFQPHTAQAEKLYNTALELLGTSAHGNIFDLYCGTGAIGMSLAGGASEVTGIELNPYAVFDADASLADNQIKNMKVICGDVGKVLTSLPTSKKVDVVVVDPPRAGLDTVAIEQVRRLSPRKILYISCNPATQVRDVLVLEKEYRVSVIQPVDQFPHTPHIENIVVLEKI